MTVALLPASAAALTPLGDLEDTLAAIARGERAGVRDPALGLVVARLAAPPPPKRQARIAGELAALTVDVARRAIAACRVDPARVGCFVAAGDPRVHWADLAPAMAEQTADATSSWTRGIGRLHPLWMLRYLSNAAHGLVAAELGLVGDGATFAGAAAVASALEAADRALEDGTIDAALVLALDDVASDEAALELEARNPALVPACAIAAVVVTRVADDAMLVVDAVDGVAHELEPSAEAIAAVRSRLAPADRQVDVRSHVGWAGTAAPLVDLLVAARQIAERSYTSASITAAGVPGQIGAMRIERRNP